jgi:copper chaperone CopZ
MVYGNCDQCKATIEKAGKINGVSSIDWNEDSKLLSLKMDTSVVSVDAVLKSIAASGYDNELYEAGEQAYSNLPDCCQYDRKK